MGCIMLHHRDANKANRRKIIAASDSAGEPRRFSR
jgi:hypothetical protein